MAKSDGGRQQCGRTFADVAEVGADAVAVHLARGSGAARAIVQAGAGRAAVDHFAARAGVVGLVASDGGYELDDATNHNHDGTGPYAQVKLSAVEVHVAAFWHGLEAQ